MDPFLFRGQANTFKLPLKKQQYLTQHVGIHRSVLPKEIEKTGGTFVGFGETKSQLILQWFSTTDGIMCACFLVYVMRDFGFGAFGLMGG